MNNPLGASWKSSLAGYLTGGLLFLQSWMSNGKTINWKDPALLIGLGVAIIGAVAKDKNVTGGTVLNSPPASDAEELKASAAKVQ